MKVWKEAMIVNNEVRIALLTAMENGKDITVILKNEDIFTGQCTGVYCWGIMLYTEGKMKYIPTLDIDELFT